MDYVIIGVEGVFMYKFFFLVVGDIWSDFFIGGVWLIIILFDEVLICFFL